MLLFFRLVLASPNLAFVLLVIGVLGIYRELVNPGRIVPGLFGLALTVVAAYCLWQHGPTLVGGLLILAAIALFIVESLWNLYFLPGILATLLLIDGFRRLIPDPQGIHLTFAAIGSCILGGVTMLLAYGARRARHNKWSDIPPAT